MLDRLTRYLEDGLPGLGEFSGFAWPMVIVGLVPLINIGLWLGPTSIHGRKYMGVVQGGPLPVISGVISPINGLING